jgi:hypothetical protein
MVMEYLSLKIVSLSQCREPSSSSEESEKKGDRNEQEQEQEQEAMQCYLRGLDLLLKENAGDNYDRSYHHDHDHDHPTGRRLTFVQILRSKLLFSYAQYLYFQNELGGLFELYYILYISTLK